MLRRAEKCVQEIHIIARGANNICYFVNKIYVPPLSLSLALCLSDAFPLFLDDCLVLALPCSGIEPKLYDPILPNDSE